MTDPVNHPAHYGVGRFGCECIELTRHLGFAPGNAIKYLWRHEDKTDPIEDLRKAFRYLRWAREDDYLPSVTVSVAPHVRYLVVAKILPHLDGLDPVYRAIPAIVHGGWTAAMDLIDQRITELT